MTETIELRIGSLIPGLNHPDDDCVQRLRDVLESHKGIRNVRISRDPAKPDVVCIQFDPKVLSVGEIRHYATQAGAELARRYGHLVLETAAMDARRARRMGDRLRKIRGVLDAGVSADGVVRVEFDRTINNAAGVCQAIEKLGLPIRRPLEYEPEEIEPEVVSAVRTKPKEEHEHGGIFGRNSELIFAIICGAVLLVGWLLSWLRQINPWVPWTGYALAYFFGGYYIVREALEKLRVRRFEIDFLMIVAAGGAAVLDAWAEGALLLFLFAIGHALEHYAMGRARRAIEALAELAPETAIVRRDGREEEIPIDDLRPGDVVVVKTHERIPADGFVIAGQSSVNQAPITGESIPVEKRPVEDIEQAAANPDRVGGDSRVFAGTINQSGSLEVYVTRLAAESTLARVVAMVSEAETQRSPTQQFTDKFERYFVPAVIALDVLLLFAFVVIDEPFSESFYRAMAVLVAASPCALAISTPSAVLSAVARAARGGVLVKGGGPLENLGQLHAMAFDKTGTLTEGRPRVTDIVACQDVSESELLRNVIAVEKLSDHPLAAAIVKDGIERLQKLEPNSVRSKETIQVPQADELASMVGRGIRATVDGHTIFIGKDDLFSEIDGPALPEALRAIVDRLEGQGRTTVIARRDEQYLGVIGLMDTPRADAAQAIARLRRLGIRRMIMISGDNQRVAQAVARSVGISEAWGDLMPEDKVEAIKKLRAEGPVAMVGDGVNDAPAMANATVGIAMGAAGSDVALETADIALMADNLSHLPFAVGLSRQSSRIIRQNLWYSLGMVAILVPATILGLRIGFAVVLHEGSTLVVVFNALRLLAYRER